MSEEEDRSRNKEKRLEQKEKIDAETQRSLAVAEMKKAHKLIEETEKSRKRPILLSICNRMRLHVAILSSTYEMLSKRPFAEKPIYSNDLIKDLTNKVKTYESIRFDFQKNLEIGDEEMARFFPNVELDVTTGYSANIAIYQMISNLTHMRIYCERMLLS